MAAVSFTKVEGLGNDFILLDRTDHAEDLLAESIEWARAQATALCERRTGIGADGLLVVGPARGEAIASMTVINADGSRPEMCGNGLRCVAAWVAERFASEVVHIDTDAGLRECRVVRREGMAAEVRIDMGPAVVSGKRLPKAGGGREFVSVSIGNPHAVCFVEAIDDPETLARHYGPAVENDAAYQPAKTNVEFAQLEDDGSISLWVWERGVGITAACGTGACATAAAAVSEGLVAPDQPVLVTLPGGTLTIVVPADSSRGVAMTGPCRQVFSGVVEV